MVTLLIRKFPYGSFQVLQLGFASTVSFCDLIGSRLHIQITVHWAFLGGNTAMKKFYTSGYGAGLCLLVADVGAGLGLLFADADADADAGGLFFCFRDAGGA